ncbi:hypothetical protein FHU38_000586 [Saccharomonospora amisosensis]|uniref:Uncharacterized protein n=1 Tax=Saccharomonospora amisosensis TaxID=1128677 RepID=A0A7X5ZP13_9PSEU|nr:hypothetical protein [Saccharomonospora amisosensis]NIJ10242.1 hypothetical protein [Saccharomonospora amisosensis]
MPLPHWTPEHVLPPGRHPADLSDLYERFVWDAPHRNEREIIFSALSGYLGVVCRLIPSGRAWVGGELTNRTAHAPRDVDVVLIPDEWGALKRLDGAARATLYGMLTLRGVIAEQPVMYLEQVQPVSGLLDGFLCHPGDEDEWAAIWARGPVAGTAKGFAEVTW